MCRRAMMDLESRVGKVRRAEQHPGKHQAQWIPGASAAEGFLELGPERMGWKDQE